MTVRTTRELPQVIRGAGHRVTQSRLAVLQVLAAADGVLDAARFQGAPTEDEMARLAAERQMEPLSIQTVGDPGQAGCSEHGSELAQVPYRV